MRTLAAPTMPPRTRGRSGTFGVVLEDVKHQQLLPAGDELVATGEGSEGGA